jgi:hypothetical protein
LASFIEGIVVTLNNFDLSPGEAEKYSIPTDKRPSESVRRFAGLHFGEIDAFELRNPVVA